MVTTTKATKGARAVLYVRVSTVEQAESGTSLDSQEERCRAYCQQNGYSVVGVYREEGVSGATLVRPQLDRLRDAMRDGLADVVVIYSLDRLSRDTAHTLTLLKEFKQKGAELKSATVPLEADPAGQLLLTMLSAIAQYERTQILERSRRGKESTARQGRVLGTQFIPFGYRYLQAERRYELVEEQAAIVQQIFSDVVERRLSMFEVARRLNEREVPTPQGGRRWHNTTVKCILKNPLYTGRLAWNKSQSVPQNGTEGKGNARTRLRQPGGASAATSCAE